MNPKQTAFIREYLIDRNGTHAAIRVGYSPTTAYSTAERMLRNAEVRAAVDAGLTAQAARLTITADQVQQARAWIAISDPRRLFDQDGQPLPPNQLDEATAAAVTGIDLNDDGSFKRYRLEAKVPHLAALSKHSAWMNGVSASPCRLSMLLQAVLRPKRPSLRPWLGVAKDRH